MLPGELKRISVWPAGVIILYSALSMLSIVRRYISTCYYIIIIIILKPSSCSRRVQIVLVVIVSMSVNLLISLSLHSD